MRTPNYPSPSPQSVQTCRRPDGKDLLYEYVCMYACVCISSEHDSTGRCLRMDAGLMRCELDLTRWIGSEIGGPVHACQNVLLHLKLSFTLTNG